MTRHAIVAILFMISGPLAAAEGENADLLHRLQAQVSAERIETDINVLASFGTRHTLSETASDSRGIGAARRCCSHRQRQHRRRAPTQWL